MIDLTQLTQEQQWGVEFATLEANKPIQAENEQIEVAFYTRKWCIKNVGGATSLVGTIDYRV